MKTFTFTVIGQPKGQPRPRAFAKKMGNGKFVARVYDAGTAEGWKGQVAIAAKDLNDIMLEGPISLSMHCQFKRPASHFRSGKNKHILKDNSPAQYKTSKPDLDNIIKAGKDALTVIGAWKDDAQVCQELLSKTWGASDKTEFTITALC